MFSRKARSAQATTVAALALGRGPTTQLAQSAPATVTIPAWSRP